MMQPAEELQPRGAFISEGLGGGGSGGHGRRLLTDRETAVGAAASFLLLHGRQPSSLTLDGAGDREAARSGGPCCGGG